MLERGVKMKAMLCDKVEERKACEMYCGLEYKANIKFDGERIIAVCNNGEVTLVNRRGNVKNLQYPEIVEELEGFDAVLDGEVISVDDDFNKLQRRQVGSRLKADRLRTEVPVKYVVFDVLKVGNDDLTNKPLSERVARLVTLKCRTDKPKIEVADYMGVRVAYEKAKAQNREGIVIKDMDSLYEGKRSKSWVKCKFFKEISLRVQSYTINNAGIRVEDSEGNAVQVAGQQHKAVKQAIDEVGSCEIVVQYLQKTKGGRLRNPSFKERVDLRDEKNTLSLMELGVENE